MKCAIRNMKLLDINHVMDVNMKFLPENYYKEYWLTGFNKGKKHCFVATIGNEIIGYIFSDKEHIVSFAVDDKYRKQGIGISLIQHCLNSFEMNESIILYCRMLNEKALSLYAKFGFKKIEHLKNYYVNPQDDAFKMQLVVVEHFKTNKKISISI